MRASQLRQTPSAAEPKPAKKRTPARKSRKKAANRPTKKAAADGADLPDLIVIEDDPETIVKRLREMNRDAKTLVALDRVAQKILDAQLAGVISKIRAAELLNSLRQRRMIVDKLEARAAAKAAAKVKARAAAGGADPGREVIEADDLLPRAEAEAVDELLAAMRAQDAASSTDQPPHDPAAPVPAPAVDEAAA